MMYVIVCRIMYLVLVCSCTMIVLLGLSSVGIFAYYYHERCGPLESGEVSSPNQVRGHLAKALSLILQHCFTCVLKSGEQMTRDLNDCVLHSPATTKYTCIGFVLLGDNSIF